MINLSFCRFKVYILGYTVKTNVSEITHIVFNMTHYGVKKRHPHIVSIFIQ